MKPGRRDCFIDSDCERGLGGIEGLAFGVLIFVFGTLLLSNAWGVVDAKLAAAAAAREGARAYVEASGIVDAQTNASSAANAAMAGHNRVLSALNVAGQPGGYERCSAIIVTAHTEVPRIALPLLKSSGGIYNVSASHTEVIDPYRAGLAGVANCSSQYQG